MSGRVGFCVLGVFLFLASCTSSFIPQDTKGKLVAVARNGNTAYVRDGRTYSGVFGGGLVRAVRGVPKAESAAKKARRYSIAGLVSFVGGVACAGAALYTLDGDEGLEDTHPALSACVLAGTGLTTLALSSGLAYRFDAVNYYNAWVDAHGPLP